MPIRFPCPSCGRELQVRDEFAGRTGRCSACNATFTVPEPVIDLAGFASTAMATKPVAPPPAAPPIPTAEPAPETVGPAFSLYAPYDVLIATFLSNPFGGALVLGINSLKLGSVMLGALLVLLGLTWTAALIILMTLYPLSPPMMLAAHVPGIVVLFLVAYLLQGRAYAEHRRQGGPKASTWWAVGLALVVAVVSVAAMYELDSMLASTWGPSYLFGGDEVVHYGDGTTEADARALASALADEDLFSGTGEMVVRVSRPPDGWVLAFLVDESAGTNEATHLYYLGLGARLSAKLYRDAPVEIQLYDDWLHRLKSVRGRRIDYGKKEELYYDADIKEEDALRLGDALRRTRYFDGSGNNHVYLTRGTNTLVVSCVVKKDSWNDAETAKYYIDLRRQLAELMAPAGALELRMVDGEFAVGKTFR